jgi:hypothetical protein
VELLAAVAGRDTGEGEREVEIPQTDVDRAPPAGAADHREAPDAVGGQVVADAGLQADPRRVTERAEQVGDDRQLLPRADSGGRIAQVLHPQPGALQAGLRRESVVRAQANQQLHARRRALDVPANHDSPPHRREEGRNPP